MAVLWMWWIYGIVSEFDGKISSDFSNSEECDYDVTVNGNDVDVTVNRNDYVPVNGNLRFEALFSYT